MLKNIKWIKCKEVISFSCSFLAFLIVLIAFSGASYLLAQEEKTCGDPLAGSEVLLGGSEDPCDGYDNDSDGTIDEGCDQTCDNPEKWGSDVRVTNDSSNSFVASLVWTGSEYGVSWYDDRDGNQEIYFTRLDSSGSQIGSDIRVTNNSATSNGSSLAWTGSEYGISWRDDRDGNTEVYFVRLDASGTKIGSDIRVTNQSANSSGGFVIWAGTEYGISWYDDRDGNWEIYFARLDSSGTKIGSDVRVTNYSGNSWYPALIWTGSEYGVSWEDDRDGDYEIYFARLDSTGAKIGSDVRVTNNLSIAEYPSLAWTGSEYGISWNDDRHGGFPNVEIYFARLDSSGTKIGSDVRVTFNASISYFPSLVWTGSEYGISWNDYRDGNDEIYFARLNSSGTKISSDERITNAALRSYSPSLVWTGSDYGVSFHDYRDGTGSDPPEIYFARIACCDDVDSDTYSECAGDCNDQEAAVNPGATELCDGIDNNCDGSIDEDVLCDTDTENPGKNGDDDPVTDDDGNDSFYSSMDWNGSEYGVVWEDERDGNFEIYFTRLDTSGAEIGSNIRISNNSGSSLRPEIKWAGDKYGVAWYDDSDGNEEIYFTTLSSTGTKLIGDIRVTNSSDESSFPSLMWNGSVFSLAWQDSRDYSPGSTEYEIYFVRLDANGNNIGSDIRVTNYSSIKRNPVLGWDGVDYGVAWEDNRDGNFEIYYARLDELGNKQEHPVSHATDIRITSAEGDSVNVDLLWNGSKYGLVWQDNRPTSVTLQGGDNIYSNGIDSIGDKDGDDIIITSADSDSTNPSMAWSGGEWGVAFSDDRDGTDNQEIYFACLYPDGTEKVDEVRITDAPNVSESPALVWNGEDYGTTWQDLRNGTSYEVYFASISDCHDDDLDTYTQCDGDCDEGDADTYPGASEICDGLNNDCDDPIWPQIRDIDGDDSEDACDPDDDNDGTPDESDPYPCDPGNDIDGDDIPCNLSLTCGAIDNCCDEYNPGQSDGDQDGEGDACEQACTFFIDDDGGSGIDCTSIQECVGASTRAGCVFIVYPGTYHENITIPRVLTLIGDSGADVTTIDGPGTTAVVNIQSITPTGFVKIKGFTIVDGSEGISINHNADIENCRIQNVSTGILINNQDAKVTDTIIDNPTVGIHIDNSSSNLDILRGTINNTTSQGILVDGVLNAVNTLITDNSGDGIELSASGTADIEFCAITNNSVGVDSLNGSPTAAAISTSILYGNTTEFSGIDCSVISYSDTDSSCDGTNDNISLDPLFVDASSGNYRLQVDSPCIDGGYDPSTYTGNPCCDFDQHQRLLDKDGDGFAQPDMGVFEHDNSINLTPGDVQNARFTTSKDTLQWDSEPNSVKYNVYRDLLNTLGYNSYGACHGSSNGTSYYDDSIPPGTGCYYYLVTGVKGQKEGTLGFGTCAERSNYTPCP
jgi:hypothetical protein